MTRWRRRVRIVLGLAVALALVRTAWSLRPPAVPATGQEWQVLTGVTVVNPGRDRRTNQTLSMRAGRIASIVDRVPDSEVLARARLYEGRYVLPGLIDMHVRHLPRRGPFHVQFGMMFLLAGVTTIRELGEFDDRILELQERIAAGEVAWPRLIACGRIVPGDSPACLGGRSVGDAADAGRAVDELAAMGAACVAVRAGLRADTLAAVHAAARAQGLSVVGEVPPGVPAGAAPIDDVLLISAAPSAATETPVADWWRGWQAADAADLDELARAASARGTAYTPSLLRWSYLTEPAARPASLDIVLPFLPRFYREVNWQRELAALARDLGEADQRAASGVPAAMHAAVARLHAAGVRIHAGTGAPGPWLLPGFSMWSEMFELVAAGLTTEEAWAAASRIAGESLGIPQLGVLEAGAPADLLVFREDPTNNLGALNSLEAVVTQGRLYPTAYLNRNALEYARYFERPLYDRLSVWLARFSAWWHGEACDDWQ